MKVGFVGTGTMGGLMARSLLSAGHAVAVYDRKPEAIKRLLDAGAIPAGSPRAVAEMSEVVFTSLPGPAEVEQVVLDREEGILAGLAAGGAFIDTTTNSPTVIRKLAAACRSRSIDILDAAATGKPPGMVMMVGGDEPVFARYQPVLDDMAKAVFYMGEIGQGMVAKASHQLIGFVNFFGLIEALLIGAKSGMDIGRFMEMHTARRGAGDQGGESGRLPGIFKGVFTGYPISMALKDASVACELAELTAVDAPLATLIRDIMKRAQTEGLGEQPFGSIVRILERAAGVELRTNRGATPGVANHGGDQ